MQYIRKQAELLQFLDLYICSHQTRFLGSKSKYTKMRIRHELGCKGISVYLEPREYGDCRCRSPPLGQLTALTSWHITAGEKEEQRKGGEKIERKGMEDKH